MQAKKIFCKKNLCIPNFCCNFAADFENNHLNDMSKGQLAWVSPELSGLAERVKGVIINIRNNPFLGEEIAVRDDSGRVFFGASNYFTLA